MYFILHPISSLNHLVARLATDQITLALSIILFVFLALTYKTKVWQVTDQVVSELAVESKGNFIKDHAKDFSIFGNAIFHILFCVVLSIIFFIAKHKFSVVLAIFFTLIFSWGLNRAMKLIYKRERPPISHLPSPTSLRKSYCFPSGHIMASIPIYFFSAMLLQSIIPFLPWYLVALLVCFFVTTSRIYLNHHYFTDVLGGILMGIFCLSISIWFYFFLELL